MEKIKKITVSIKRWQAGMVLAMLAILLSFVLAATFPPRGENEGLILFHLFGMVVSGMFGTVLFAYSVSEMWEKWDA